MSHDPAGATWRSLTRFRDEPTPDLVVACSDGRFARAFEEFAQTGLGLDRCARLVVPGGPAFLAVDDGDWARRDHARDLLFILDALRIERAHLIQHDLCAYYQQVLGAEPADLGSRQRADLDLAEARLCEARPSVAVRRWRATVEAGAVVVAPC